MEGIVVVHQEIKDVRMVLINTNGETVLTLIYKNSGIGNKNSVEDNYNMASQMLEKMYELASKKDFEIVGVYYDVKNDNVNEEKPTEEINEISEEEKLAIKENLEKSKQNAVTAFNHSEKNNKI